jgi:hypothetical protein
MDLEEARDHLELAKKQWEHAATDSWPPREHASCVTNAFYAYENLLVAVAEALGQKWTKSHYKKAELAAELFKDKILTTDVSDTLLRMNDLRKDVSYGEPGYDLKDADLEDIVSDLEKFVDEVETIVTAAEEKAEEEEDDEDEDEDKESDHE